MSNAYDDDVGPVEDDVPYFDQVGRIGLSEWLGKMYARGLTELGSEKPDPTVIAPPLGQEESHEDVFMRMYRMLAEHQKKQMEEAEAEGEEFPEEDWEEDEPWSPYEERNIILSGLQLKAYEEAKAREADAPAKAGADAPSEAPSSLSSLGADAAKPTG